MAGILSTTFQPDPTCAAASHLWLSTARCMTLPYSRQNSELPCTYVFQGRSHSTASATNDECFAARPATIAYTNCPESYTAAAVSTDQYGSYDLVNTYCCPTAYSYHWSLGPFTSWLGETFTGSVTFRKQPACQATSVSVLQSHIVTVTLGGSASGGDDTAAPALTTTTVEWAGDGILFAEAETVRAYVYPSAPATPSTCWGPSCPLSYDTTPTFASPVPTAPPTARFTPPPECLDPGNLWVVTTSCYLTSPSGALRGPGAPTPDWLHCSMTHFGAPAWDDPTCAQSGVKTTATTTATENGADAVGQEVLYYDECPSGYTGVASGSSPGYNTMRYNVGWFDISYYSTFCCPTEYGFQAAPTNAGQTITTEHDGTTYGVWVYAMPGCWATSVAALASRGQVPLHTTSNAMAWDKRQEEGGGGAFPTTAAWDLARGTVFAHGQALGRTVFMGTHTCYDECAGWLTYYYPDGTGGPTPSTAVRTSSAATATATAETSGASASGTSVQGSGSEAAPSAGASLSIAGLRSSWAACVASMAVIVVVACFP